MSLISDKNRLYGCLALRLSLKMIGYILYLFSDQDEVEKGFLCLEKISTKLVFTQQL